MASDLTGHDGWRKAARSYANGQCVEVGRSQTAVIVRDTADRRGPVIEFSPAAWAAFTTSL